MSKRKLCNGCERPLKVCLCDVLLSVSASVKVIVLQDKNEAKHALSTVPIIQKMLNTSNVYIGEEFNPREIFHDDPDWKSKTCLIFPAENALALESSRVTEQSFKYVILLDGTWRKAKRLWFLNPWLAEIPAFKISQKIKGRYQIRKAPGDDAYSTLEALVATLETLSPETNGNLLLAAFDQMIALQIEAMGEKTFNANYKREAPDH